MSFKTNAIALAGSAFGLFSCNSEMTAGSERRFFDPRPTSDTMIVHLHGETAILVQDTYTDEALAHDKTTKATWVKGDSALTLFCNGYCPPDTAFTAIQHLSPAERVRMAKIKNAKLD